MLHSTRQVRAKGDRHTREDFHFDHLPDSLEDLPQEFLMVLDPTGIKLKDIRLSVCHRAPEKLHKEG
ncbi:MAG: hypothetical protein NZL86_03495 [Aquificaceae bacterium]|nr:hypothetical protein [Aquificaceae bacterium]